MLYYLKKSVYRHAYKEAKEKRGTSKAKILTIKNIKFNKQHFHLALALISHSVRNSMF